MTARVVGWCSCHPRIVIALALVAAVAGERARRGLARDAIPELAEPRVAVVAEWMGHPATEVARAVAQPLTAALERAPGVTAVRGSSMSGMAYVDVVFAAGGDLDGGRRRIAEHVAALRPRLPPNVRLQVGPVAASTGWVFQYVLVDRTRRESPAQLRRVQDTLLRPALAALPGVAEVATVGGDPQHALIAVRPDQLRARKLAFTDVLAALRPVAHGPANLRPIGATPVTSAAGNDGASPPRIADVAHMKFAQDMPTSVADLDGDAHVVGGVVIARRDADVMRVVDAVKRKLAELGTHLRHDVELVTVYDRTELVANVGNTLLRALAEEIAVVVLVILLFLLHVRSALVPLATLPLVLLLTFAGMYVAGVSATIMSLGGIAIALGMAVDAEVVALEACHRRLEALGEHPSARQRRDAIVAAAGSFAPAIVTSLLITAVSFLPVFAFTGETGRLLRPLALTKTLIIAATALVAITVAPALRDRLLAGRVMPEFDNPITRRLVRMYRPFVHFGLRRPALTLVTAALAVLSCLPILGRLGGEFLPRIDEGDLLFMPTTLAGITPGEAAVQLRRQDAALARFDEVATVFGKVGRATTATDPAPYSMAETTLRLRPRSEWPAESRARWYSSWAPGPIKRLLGLVWPEATPPTTAELVSRLDRAVTLPGWRNAWTAPARARMDMLATGVHTPVGIRIVAADPARLDVLGDVLRRIAERVPGAGNVVFESLATETWPRFDVDEAAAARHGVEPTLASSTAALMLAGGQVGELEWQGEPYRLRIAVDGDGAHAAPDRLRDVSIRSRTGQPVPLALLGRLAYATEPSLLRSERGEPVAYVHVSLQEGTDVQSYVEAARRAVDHARDRGELRLRGGERIEWTGQYRLLADGARRLAWIAPLAGLLMLLLLLLLFRNVTEALIVLASVPFALVGSFWTLYLADYPVSAPVWVGLLSAVGLAMQTGVVMVVYIDDAFHRRVRDGRIQCRDDIVAAHAEGTVQRLRPKLMTITTMAAGLLPLVWADGAGAEIMRRVAAPMLGGLATSAFLTLEVLPVLYTIWRHRQLRRAQRTGVPLAAVVGPGPAWTKQS